MKQVIKRVVEADQTFLFDAFEEFIEVKTANNLSPSTLDNYRTTFKIFCNDNGFDETTLTSAIGEKTIYAWIGHMKNEDLSISSCNHYLRDIRSFMNYCFSKDYTLPFRIKLLANQEEQIKYFTEEEMEKLIEKPRRNDGFATWRTWAIVNTILATGARASTICAMRIEDINFSRSEIIYSHTKNKKAQVVPLSQSLATALKEYMRMYRPSPTGWLFPNVGDEQLTTNALRLAFGRYCKDREVEKTNIHGLRHSFSRGWVLNNGNMFALQNILGHSSTEMTKRYVKIFGEELKEGYEDFSVLDTMKKGKSRKNRIVKN